MGLLLLAFSFSFHKDTNLSADRNSFNLFMGESSGITMLKSAVTIIWF